MAAEDVRCSKRRGTARVKCQKIGDKRVKLWPIETMACQGLNPHGPAQISVAPLEVWKAASTPHGKNCGFSLGTVLSRKAPFRSEAEPDCRNTAEQVRALEDEKFQQIMVPRQKQMI